MSTGDNFAVVWQSESSDGDGLGIVLRRFCNYASGDADGSHEIDVADIFYMINRLFAGGPLPVHDADANGDGNFDNYLFAGGLPPACNT